MTSNSGWRGNSSRRESARPSRPQPDWKGPGPKGAAGQPRRVNKKKLLAPILGILAVIVIGVLVWNPAKPLSTTALFLNSLKEPEDFENQLGFQTPQIQQDPIFQRFQVVEPKELESGLQADKFRDVDVVVVLLQTHLIPTNDDDFACVTRGTNPDLSRPRKLGELMSEVIGIRDSGKNVLLMVDCPTARTDWRTDLPGCNLRSFFEKYFSAGSAGKNQLGSLTIVCSATLSGDSEPGSPNAGGLTRLSYAFQKSFSRESAEKDEDLRLKGFLENLQKSFNEFKTPGIGFHQPELMILGQSREMTIARSPGELRDFVLFRKMQQKAPQIIASKDEPELLKRSQELWRKMAEVDLARRWPEQWNSIAEQLVSAERAYFQGQNKTAGKLIKFSGDRLDQALKQRQQPVAAAAKVADVTGSLDELSSQIEAAYQKYGRGIDANRYVQLRHDFEDVVEICETQQCVYLLYETLREVHQQLLEAEDRSFSLRPEDRLEEKGMDELEKLVTSLKNFAQAYGDAFRTADGALKMLPGTAFWCSRRATLPAWASSESEWLPHLKRLCDDSDGLLRLKDVMDLEATLNGLQDSPSELAPLSRIRAARVIRSHAILSLAYSKGLMKELDTLFREADEQSKANDLSDSFWATRTEKLTGWTAKAAQELKSLEEEFRKAIEEETATLLQGTDEQSLQHAFLYEALPLTFLGDRQRVLIHEKLREIRKTASGLTGQPSTDEADVQRRALTELRWATALTNLLVNTPSEQRKGLAEIAVKDDPLSHNNIAEASAKLRNLWSKTGTEVKASYDNVEGDAFSRAVTSSLACRLLTKYDLPDVGKRPQSVVDRVSVLNQLQSDLLKADLITQSGWTDDEEKWYLTTAAKSLEQFSVVAKTIRLPSVLREQEQRIQEQLSQKYDLTLSSGDQTTIPLGSDEDRSEKIEIGGQATLPDCVNGFGAIRFGGENTSIPKDFYRFGNKDEQQTIDLKSTGPLSFTATITREGKATETDCLHDIPVQMFFRGRMWTQDTPLKISACSPIEYTTTIEPRAEKAVISVVGKDPHPVVFVLDWSDSMENKMPDGQTRYETASESLRELAIKQNIGLAHSKVFLRVFGHRTQVLNGESQTHEDYSKLFGRGEDFKAPDANKDTVVEYEGPLKTVPEKRRFESILGNLGKLTQKGTGITPLLLSLTQALETDLNNGPGLIVAITDGEPTDDGLPNPPNNGEEPDRTVALLAALKKNKHARIRIVAFNLAPVQLLPLKKVFEESTQFQEFRDRIKLISADDQERLVSEISDGVIPRPYVASEEMDGDQRPTPLDERIEVKPGLWHVRMEDSQAVEGDPGYRLSRGDTLKLNYEFNNRQFLLSGRIRKSKELWSGQDSNGVPSFRPSRVTGDARLTGDDRVNVSLWLERFSPTEFVEQPAEIEIQVAANGFKEPLKSIKQTYDSSEGVPGWKLECSEWPKEARAKVNVAWKMTRTMPDAVWQCDNDLLGHGNFESAKRLEGSNLPTGKVWFRDFLNGEQRCFEVRIDDVAGENAPENPVDRIRIELGRRTAVGQNETFTPWELRTEVIRVERAVIFRFYSDDNQLTADSIRNVAEIAFTSLRSRFQGAVIAQDLDVGVE